MMFGASLMVTLKMQWMKKAAALVLAFRKSDLLLVAIGASAGVFLTELILKAAGA